MINKAKEHQADRLVRYADIAINALFGTIITIAAGFLFWFAVAMCAVGR